MGEVIAFKRPQRDQPPEPAPAPKQPLWSFWSNPDAWAVSRKGNPYIEIANLLKGYELRVTLWRCGGRWSWCISRDDEPTWSPFGYDSEQEARAAAWEALATLEGVTKR